MNSPEEPNWQKKLEDLETEVYQTTPLVENVDHNTSVQSSLSSLVTQVQEWLKTISLPWRIAVIGGGVVILFSILNAILKLATALVSLAVLAVLIYWGYRFLTNSSNSKKD